MKGVDEANVNVLKYVALNVGKKLNYIPRLFLPQEYQSDYKIIQKSWYRLSRFDRVLDAEWSYGKDFGHAHVTVKNMKRKDT